MMIVKIESDEVTITRITDKKADEVTKPETDKINKRWIR